MEASFIARPEPPPSHSPVARVLARIVAVCGVIPYGLIALVLRLVAARAFFVDGQAKVVGPAVSPSIQGSDFSFILPAQVRADVLNSLATQFSGVAVSPAFIAYGLAYAEFLLPICLLIGFGTRIAALVLLVITIVLQIYVEPDALWTVHAYWFSILLVLMTFGAGAISLDRLIRYLYQK